MRLLLMVVLAGLLVGCEAPGPAPVSPAEKKKAEQARLNEALKQFRAFVDEAAKGVDLLESHPGRDAIKAEIGKLQASLSRAAEVDPNHEKIVPLVEDGRMMMGYFEACLKTADFQAARIDRKEIDQEKAQKAIDWACGENAPVVRQLIDRMKGRLGT